MSENTSKKKYEVLISYDEDVFAGDFTGWLPIPYENINEPERIPEFIKRGLLREMDFEPKKQNK